MHSSYLKEICSVYETDLKMVSEEKYLVLILKVAFLCVKSKRNVKMNTFLKKVSKCMDRMWSDML